MPTTVEGLSLRDPVFPIEWGALAPLRLRARTVAEGVYAGPHRSVRKGAGVEFGGQRAYVPGDDLRFIDRRALLRHDRLMVREFETETDRALWLCVDATASMAYRGDGSPGAKYAYAALLAAALARVALSSGDPVGLGFVGGDGVRPLSASSGREAFDRVVGALESARAAGDAGADASAVERAVAPIARKARRGSVIVFFSDLLDLPVRARPDLVPLATSGRTLIVVQVLDPTEAELSFSGSVRLRALEGDVVVEADVDEVRAAYKSRLADLTQAWTRDVEARGGRLVRAVTSDDPTAVARAVVRAVAEANA
ncbi:MAG: DUF58 domain-containing protein [Polyangiaceae bacterium]